MKRLNKYTKWLILSAIIILMSPALKGAKVGPLIRAFYEQQMEIKNEYHNISPDSINSIAYSIERIMSRADFLKSAYYFLTINKSLNLHQHS